MKKLRRYRFLWTPSLFAALIGLQGCTQDRRMEAVNRSFEGVTALYGELLPSAHGLIPPEELAALIRTMDSLQNILKGLENARLSSKAKQAYPEVTRKWDERTGRFRRLRSDPSLYNLGGELQRVITDPELRPADKIPYLARALENAPDYYRYARINLSQPDFERFPLAVQKQLLTLHFLDVELANGLRELGAAEDRAREMLASAAKARIAVKDYIAFCESKTWSYQDSLLQARKQ